MKKMTLLPVCKRLLSILALILIFIPAADARIDFESPINTYGVVCLVLIFIIHSLFRRKRHYVNRNSIIILIFGIVSHIPSILMYDFQTSLFHFLSIYCVYFILFANLDIKIYDMAISTIIINYYVFFRCIYGQEDLLTQSFVGTAINPNQFALILLGGLLSSLYVCVCKNNVLEKVFALSSIIINLLLVWISSSRSVMFMSIVSTIVFFMEYVKKLNIKNVKIIKVLLFFIIIAALLLFFNDIDNFFFSKWSSSSDNLTSGRTRIWGKIIIDTDVSGNMTSNINANSEYFNYYLLYGPLVFFFYSFVTIISLYKAWNLYKLCKCSETLYVFMIIVSFAFVSSFENFYSIFGKTIYVLNWAFTALLINNNISKKYVRIYKPYK